jgi:peptide-methionine (R)-S-oxide reductase
MDIDTEELKKKLTDMEYKVTQEKGTEMPFSGEYVHEKADGTYKCKVCGNPLFASGTKFDSGTGWPSFDEALPGAVNFITDDSHGMSRTEVVCVKCRAHLGHMFEDGPKETTGKRFCMNSCALDLEKK